MDRLHDAAETSGRAGSLLEIRMLQALAHDAQGHRPQALRVAWPEPWPRRPNRTATCGSSWTRAPPWSSCCATPSSQGVAGDHARRLLGLARPRRRSRRSTRSASAPPSAESLSDRELQVLRLLDSELSGPQIARELFVSHNTLRTHTKHIFTKLDVTSRRAAVRRARERGLM